MHPIDAFGHPIAYMLIGAGIATIINNLTWLKKGHNVRPNWWESERELVIIRAKRQSMAFQRYFDQRAEAPAVTYLPPQDQPEPPEAA